MKPHRLDSAVRAASPLAILFLLTPLVCGSAGCASRRTVEQLEGEVRRLQQENFDLRKDLTEARVRRQMQADLASRTERRKASTPAAPLPRRPETRPESRAGGQDEPRAPAVIYSEPITDGSAYITSTPSKARPSQPMPASEASRMLMDSAQASLDVRDPEGALVHFREIVVNHPGEAIADDAQFGIGECYFQMGKYEEAMTEYRRVIDNFPFGDRVPYAWLKIGFAQLALEQRDVALRSFRTVSEGFPGTEAATVARQQIAHLNK